jgi:hypothetical protein
MSSHWLEVAGLFDRKWRFTAGSGRPVITWWPISLPGSDLEDAPRRRQRRPARRPLRRGRIQFVAA